MNENKLRERERAIEEERKKDRSRGRKGQKLEGNIQEAQEKNNECNQLLMMTSV